MARELILSSQESVRTFDRTTSAALSLIRAAFAEVPEARQLDGQMKELIPQFQALIQNLGTPLSVLRLGCDMLDIYHNPKLSDEEKLRELVKLQQELNQLS